MHNNACQIRGQRTSFALATATLTVAWALGGGHAHARPPTTTVPTAGELSSELEVIFDTNAVSTLRASYLEAGVAALPVANTLAGPMAQHRTMVSMRVEDPTLNDDRLSSELVMEVRGIGAQRRPIEWVERDGSWKLSTDSLCSMYNEVSRAASCPL